MSKVQFRYVDEEGTEYIVGRAHYDTDWKFEAHQCFSFFGEDCNCVTRMKLCAESSSENDFLTMVQIVYIRPMSDDAKKVYSMTKI